jgi:hypothetical protein
MSFSAYVVTTCKSTDITDFIKHMFFWSRLCLEICGALRKSKYYLTFDACLRARIEVKTVLCLDAEYNKAFKSASKRQAANKTIKDKGGGKAHHDSSKCRSSQGVS